ncbi:caspase family protein [Couchioplanes caeruleus]|uniref:Peptidase C14 caspase domain-containing protein n=2 Tax=Couchioplanes caeruleus TaxID=56438 RepID=A0A1K0FN18_9ACTN|nr:caspase family protein [Couchioplanes caeruleus]OJF14185.1 hypothetical protein BG844_11040 [Couchioplanes caeruleus subsp. caeruleus]ROP28310.1 caspase domain-containing protein [Couchioplanes caeruleus]
MDGPRYRALLIGNWQFPEEPALQDLNGPCNDVEALARLFSHPVIGLIAPEDVTTLCQQTSFEINSALEDFFTSATRNEVLIVYYSGHGVTTDGDGSLLLCARDTRLDRKLATTVRASLINDLIQGSAVPIVIIVLDCCFAGSFKDGDASAHFAGRGRYVLSATRSRDRAPDATHSAGLSRFTLHVVQGLGGAAALPGQDHVTIHDLYQYTLRKMRAEGPVRPLKRFDGDGDDPLIAKVGQILVTVPAPPARGWDLNRLKDVLTSFEAAIPRLEVEPGSRRRVEKGIRRLGGVSDAEATLAVADLPGGPGILFTDRAMYWMDRDRHTTLAIHHREFGGRTFALIAAASTHIDLGDGVARLVGSAAPAVVKLLTSVGRLGYDDAR